MYLYVDLQEEIVLIELGNSRRMCGHIWREAGLPSLLHAELRADGKSDPNAHPDSHPEYHRLILTEPLVSQNASRRCISYT